MADPSKLLQDQAASNVDLAAYIASATADSNALTVANTVTIPGLQAQVKQLTTQVAAKPLTGQVHTVTSPTTLAVNATSIGDTYDGPTITAAQQYAVLLNDGDIVTNLTAKSGSGGIRCGGPNAPKLAQNIIANGLIGSGCGQNGVSVYSANSTYNGIETDGNNVANFDVYSEGGAGKIWASQNNVFNGWNAKNNLGPGPWSDGGSINNTYNGGTWQGSTVAGHNVGKQVSSGRCELANGETYNGQTYIAGAGQNSAFVVSDSSNITFNGPTFHGQFGITDNGRKTATTATGQTIDTSMKGILLNGANAYSSFYWPDTMTPAFNGTKFHLAAGATVAYITHAGKPSTPIMFDQFKATYDATATLTVIS